jgi:peptide/nickel transport system permease protein
VLGSDTYGRDQFSRILYGGQISLLAGLLGASLTLLLGASIGTMAGYYGGWRDGLLMRLAELFTALPWLYLLFALRAFLPLAVSPLEAFLLVIVVIGTVGWARPARLVRGVVLSAKERDFVRAARGFGASDGYLLRRHILPATSSVLLTQAAILVPQFVLAEMTLSFLGLGVPEPVPSWGNLLATLQQYSVLVSYWWMYLPALAIVPFFLGYLGLASALQERSQAYKIEEASAESPR